MQEAQLLQSLGVCLFVWPAHASCSSAERPWCCVSLHSPALSQREAHTFTHACTLFRCCERASRTEGSGERGAHSLAPSLSCACLVDRGMTYILSPEKKTKKRPAQQTARICRGREGNGRRRKRERELNAKGGIKRDWEKQVRMRDGKWRTTQERERERRRGRLVAQWGVSLISVSYGPYRGQAIDGKRQDGSFHCVCVWERMTVTWNWLGNNRTVSLSHQSLFDRVIMW